MAVSDVLTRLSSTISAIQVIISQAIKRNDQPSVERLLSVCSLNHLHPLLCIANLLETAIRNNRLEIVRLLINEGASINSPLNWLKQNALHIAAMSRNRDMIMCILESDGDWKAVDENGANVIHLVLLGANGMKSKVESDRVKTNLNLSKHEQNTIIEILGTFINLGLDVNEFTKYNESSLELAVKSGMIDVAKFLIQSDADPYILDRHGDRLPHMLIKNIIKQNDECSLVSQTQLLNFLRWMQLEDIEINLANLDEVTPLQLAIKYKLETLLPILMELDYLNVVNTHNQTNLHVIIAKFYDAKFGSKEVESDSTIFNLIKKLLDDGADVNAVDKNGNTPLHVVAKQKDSRLIELMLKHFDNVNAQSNWKETVLHILIGNCIDGKGKYEKFYEQFVEILISRGADVNMKNGSGKTPAQLAVHQKHGGILKILADNGADLKVQTELGDDLFELLLRSKVKIEEPKGYETIVEVLLNHGFDIKEFDKNGHTSLHQATMSNNVQLIEALLKKGADVNCRDKTLRRLTPLLIAIQLSPMPVILCLLKSHADINIRPVDGETPLIMAIRKGNTDLVDNFLSAGVDVNEITMKGDSPLIAAVRKGKLDVIKLLLRKGADVNFSNETIKTTALHLAVEKNEEEVIEELLKAGADVNARNATGQTALHFAARHKSQVLENLVEAGGKIYLMDDMHRMPLHEAVETSNFVGLHYLIKLGQDINEVGRMKFTMNFAVDDKNPYDERKIEILKHLVELNAVDLLLLELDEDYLVGASIAEKCYHEQCVKEVKQLNKRVVGQVTLYEFVHMSLRSQMNHVKNFPFKSYADITIYNTIVDTKLAEARARTKLLESATTAWYEITNVNLPDLCLTNIFEYLRNDTLKIFIQCADDS